MIWGITFVMVKNALNDAPPFMFATLRFSLAFFISAVYLNRKILMISKQEIIAMLGSFFSKKSAYLYLPESVDFFLKRDDLSKKMEIAGFKNIRYVDYTFGVATLYIGDKIE
jgi:demethylmenaquinone methyltransferase/2-methoxy-6-polyprenyl-1,4-benzoquinol methylase